MKISQYLTIVVMISGMMSCVTATSYFNQLPPELVLTPKYNRVAVVSAFDTELLDFREAKNEVYSNGSKELIESLVKNLSERTELDVLTSDTVINAGILHYYKPESIDQQLRREIGKQVGTPLLLVLESYSISFDQEVDVVKNEDGSKDRTAHYDLNVSALVNLYDSTGRLIDESLIERIHYDYNSRSVISGLLAAGPAMGKAGKEINVLSRNIGSAWVDKLHPRDFEVIKYIHTHKALKASTNALMARDWQTAISLLTSLTSHSETKIAGKACYNLSVAYEAIGDKELSQKWKSQASRLLGGNNLPDQADYR